jgi:hypothetical protein
MPPIPESSADQLLPAHLAMPLAAPPPAVVKEPPAYRSPPDTASACTASAYTQLLIPEPSADQLLPSHLAMFLAGLPPAVVKLPPAYTSPPDTASAATSGSPPIPEPSGDQLLPFHLATKLAAVPPAVVKWPPAYRSLPDTASADTHGVHPWAAPIPEPSGDQLVPFHLAM